MVSDLDLGCFAVCCCPSFSALSPPPLPPNSHPGAVTLNALPRAAQTELQPLLCRIGWALPSCCWW